MNIKITTENVTHKFSRMQSEVGAEPSSKSTVEAPSEKLMSMTMESAFDRLSRPGDKVITPEFSSQLIGWLEELKELRVRNKELIKENNLLKIKNNQE